MLFSIYPSDDDALRAEALEAARQSGEKRLFTSLNMPEDAGFDAYLAFLKHQHTAGGFSFCADISPVALERLHGGVERLAVLREYGVDMVRVDSGLPLDDVKKIAHGPLNLAVNASALSEAAAQELISAAGGKLIAWHNYYPRPETGISESFFAAQNALFIKHHIPVYAFIPGETSRRMPPRQGLPTLESARYQNAYRNYLALKKLCPGIFVVCSEGAVFPHHLAWIQRYEAEHILTVPVACDDDMFDLLREAEWVVRAEDTGVSWRLESGCSAFTPSRVIRGEARHRGSIQADLPALGRYQGEVQIMRKDMPLNGNVAFVADIFSPYRALVDFISGREKIVFTRS